MIRIPLSRYPHLPIYKWSAYTLLVLVFMIGVYHRFAPATLGSPISRDLALSTGMLGALASMHFWAYTIAQVPAGHLVDRHGLRASAIAGCVLMATGGLMLATATQPWQAFCGPVLVALGMSLIFVSLMKYNLAWFPPRHFSLVTGITILLASLGSVLAESPTAYALRFLDWRQILGGLSAFCLLTALALLLICHESPRALRRAGANLHTVTSPRSGVRWSDFSHILRNRRVLTLFLVISATSGPFYAFLGLWAIPLFTDSFGLSVIEASHYATVALLVYSLGAPFLGLLSDRSGVRRPFIIVSTLCGTLGWAGLTLAPWTPGWWPMLMFLLLALSGASLAVIFTATRESVSRSRMGTATAFVNAGAFLFTAILQYLMGVTLGFFHNDTSTPGLQEYQLVLMLPMVCSAIGLAAAWSFPKSHDEEIRDSARG